MKQPETSQIKKVGQALVLLSTFEYTSKQQACLHQFLCQYAQNLDPDKKAEIQRLFNDNLEVTQAVDVLHDFACAFKKCGIFTEFKDEIEDLIFMLNDNKKRLE